jgi:hypothetical protein
VPSSRAAHVNPESNGLSLYVSRLPREISGALQDEQSAALLSHGRSLSQSVAHYLRTAAAVSVRWRVGSPLSRLFSRGRGGGSDVKHDRDDISENCTVHDGLESGCRLVDLCVDLSACSFFLRQKCSIRFLFLTAHARGFPTHVLRASSSA